MISAEVSIPSEQGGIEAREYINLHVDDGILYWDVLYAMVSGVDDWRS